MFDECRKTEARYTTVAALLAGAFLLDMTAILAPYRSLDFLGVFAATLWNAACVVTAWFSWKRSSRFFNLSILSSHERPGLQPRVTRAI